MSVQSTQIIGSRKSRTFATFAFRLQPKNGKNSFDAHGHMNCSCGLIDPIGLLRHLVLTRILPGKPTRFRCTCAMEL